MPEQRMHQIGEVADAVGLSLRTIRYYDEMGVVVPTGRSTGGFRLYTAEDINRLRLVKRMKPLDFSIDEMRDVLRLLDAVDDADAAVPAGGRPGAPAGGTPGDTPGGPAGDTPDAAVPDDVRDRLRMYVALAGERRERLREQLANATELADTLARAVRRAARPDR